jgi:hypothetical protein
MVVPMDSKSAEDRPELPDADDISPEERLQRLVLASLRDEYDPPVMEGAVVSPMAGESFGAGERSGAGEPATRKWRRLDLFLALVIAAAATGALLMLAIGRYDLDHDVSPASTAAMTTVRPTSQTAWVGQPPSPAETSPGPPEVAAESGASAIQPDNQLFAAPIPAAPIPAGPIATAPVATVPVPAAAVPAAPETAASMPAAPVPAAPVPAPSSLRSLPPPAAVLPKQTVDDWSSTITTRPEASKPLPARGDVGAAPRPLPAQPPLIREPEKGKPILWIYYAAGAEIASESARALAARTRRDVSSVDFLTQTEVPKVGVIRYSEEKNRVLASEMAKTLTTLGYRWKIEDLSNAVSTPHNMVEVWLPTTQDGRVAP